MARKSRFCVMGVAVWVALAGCAVPQEVREKVAVEAAIHQAYVERFVDIAPVDSLRAIIRRSSGAWTTLDQVVNPAE